jgi:sugar lactone lactonase YvrE
MRAGMWLLVLASMSASITASASAQAPTYLGQWPAPRAVGITFDASGNTYVAKFSSPIHIDVRAPDGTLLAQWGTDGQDVSSVTGPYYIAADAHGHLFIAEWVTHNPAQFPVQEFTTDGSFISGVCFYSPSPSSAPGAIVQAGGVAVDGDGRIYVTDTGNPQTQVFANDGAYLHRWPSHGNSIALDAFGHAFEVEEGGVVRKYDADSGTELAHWGSVGSDAGEFNLPQGIAADAAGNVYVTDTYNHRVQVFDNDGTFLRQWGSFGTDPGQFYRPMGIAVAPDGRIFVGDTWNGRVQIFGSLPTPAKTTSWGRLKRLYR